MVREQLVERKDGVLLSSRGVDSITTKCKCYSEAGYVQSEIAGIRFAWVDAGSLYCDWALREAKALTSPTIDFSVTPACAKCSKAQDENGSTIVNDWGKGQNDVKECSDCVMASAQAIRWSAWASQVWEHTPNEYLTPRSDLNMVNGTTAPMNGVFRGERASVIEFSLIPARYNDMISCSTCSEDYAYRMQFAKTTLGSVVDFSTKLEWHNSTEYGGKELRNDKTEIYKRYYSNSLLDNFVEERSFIEGGVANEVHFGVLLAKSDVMLSMDIGKWMSFSEAMGIMGGIIEVIVALVIVLMVRFEYMKDPKTRERLRAASVHFKERARAFSGVLRAPGDEPFDLNMLSEDEIAQLRTVFNEVDTNASGDIDEDELYEAMRRAGKRLTREHCAELFRAGDANNDGTIGFEEFAAMFTHHTHEVEEEEDAAANMFDIPVEVGNVIEPGRATEFQV